MRFVLKILSIFNTIVILLCSIAQFHHHDETGKMVIFSYSNYKFCENHYHEYNQNATNKHHCSHGCHDGNHEKEKSCSLRFSIAKVENKTYYPIIFFCEIFDDESRNISQIENQLIIPKSESFESIHYINVSLLRAPPIV